MTLTLPRTRDASPTRATVWSVALTEAKRALRHPLTWIGSVGSLWLMWTWVGGVAPVLPRDSIYLAGGLLPLMATSLLVARAATTREKDAVEIVDNLPTTRNRRTLGIQLGMLSMALLGLGLQVIGLVYVLLGGPAGRVNWWELLAGPLAVVAAAMAGVLIGRRLPHPVVAPLALLVMAFFQHLASPDTMYDWVVGGFVVEWLAPWMPLSGFGSPEELLFRPYLERFGFLIGLSLVLAIWAHHHSIAGRVSAVAVTLAFGWAVFQGATSMEDPGWYYFRVDWPTAAANQICSVENGVEYCAFPMYAQWATDWQEVIERIASLVPLELGLAIQRPQTNWGNNSDLPPDRVMVVTTMDWDRRGAPPTRRRDLAHRLGLLAVGLPGHELDSRYPVAMDASASCHGDGQARAAVTVWLSLVAAPGAVSMIDSGLAGHPGAVPVPLGPTTMGRGDVELGRAMYDLDPEQVSAKLNQKWGQVIDPATTSTDLASWFGLTAPPEPDPEEFTREACR